jgi:hypothetical protein
MDDEKKANFQLLKWQFYSHSFCAYVYMFIALFLLGMKGKSFTMGSNASKANNSAAKNLDLYCIGNRYVSCSQVASDRINKAPHKKLENQGILCPSYSCKGFGFLSSSSSFTAWRSSAVSSQ